MDRHSYSASQLRTQSRGLIHRLVDDSLYHLSHSRSMWSIVLHANYLSDFHTCCYNNPRHFEVVVLNCNEKPLKQSRVELSRY